ncbi:hypothetical protein, partial [uncultured Campylobacter sp.]|uniref:hypothetical protein n=1 Tax=uncultured Campylobacter sp. TaxID=218934 RepID=UPI0026233A49
FISCLCVFMALICGANRLLFSPPSYRIDLVGLIYQTDFSAQELFFEFDAGSSFSSFHPKHAQYFKRREFEFKRACGRAN